MFRWVLLALVPIAVATVFGCEGDSGEEARRTTGDPRTLARERGCREGDRLSERHGTVCACCHDEQFGVAGSVADPMLVERVVVEGDDGVVLDMSPNPYGNFFRHERARAPLRASIYLADGTVRRMREPAPNGSCNGCHGPEGTMPLLGTAR